MPGKTFSKEVDDVLIAEAITITTHEEATSLEVAFLLSIVLLLGKQLPRGVIEPPCDLVGHGRDFPREG